METIQLKPESNILSMLGYKNVRKQVTSTITSTKNYFNSLQLELPEIQPLSLKHGTIIYGSTIVLGSMISTTIGTYCFFGSVVLGGFVVLVESSKYLKYFVSKGNRLIDVGLFAATLYATASLGLTVSAALTIAGLGYSLVYAPYVRKYSILNK